MMIRHCVIVTLVAFASAQNGGDLDSVLKEVFGTPCQTDENVTGVCVTYYQCGKNGTVVTDGSTLIDIRTRNNDCPSYLDVCCRLENVQDKDPAPGTSSLPKGCGWRHPDGVGFRTTGDNHNEAKFGEFPWMTAIIKKEPISDEPSGGYINVYVGGGSLIHPSVVVTGAHVVYQKRNLIIRAGEWDTQTTKEPYPYQDRNVQSVVIHKDFNKGNLFYDIALLFLHRPVDLAPNVGVACLPPSRQRVDGDVRCFSSGWGKDKYGKDGKYQVIMKKVEVPVVDRKNCQKRLRSTRLGTFFELHSSFMCAGGEPGTDTCEGDGGSPLVCPIDTEKNRYMQSGIVAWGIGCGDGTPAVYVDVSNLRDWIDNEVIGKGFKTDVYTY